MFYFQTMFQQVYSGITGSAELTAVQQIAGAILLQAALFAVAPPGQWRNLGPVESVSGVLMCGPSASFLFAIVTRLVDREARLSPREKPARMEAANAARRELPCDLRVVQLPQNLACAEGTRTAQKR